MQLFFNLLIEMQVKMKITPQTRNYYVFVAVFTGHVGAFFAGTFMTWPSAMLIKFSNFDDNPLGRIITITEQSLLGSIALVGACVGVFPSGYIAKRCGRKPSMMILGVIMSISYLLMLVSNHILLLYVARFISGIGTTGILSVDAMYTAEVADKSNRGLLGTAQVVVVNCGLLFVLILGPLTTYFWFHVTLTTLPAIFVALVWILVPESPYFLIMKDMKEAEISLKKLRGVNEVKKELDYIKQSSEVNTKVRLRHIFHNRGLLKGLIIGCGLTLFQQLSGIGVVASYGQLIFAAAGDGSSTVTGPIIIMSIQLLAGLVTPLFIDELGRKIFLLISHIGMVLAQMMFGLYFFMQDNGTNVDSLSWMPLTSLILCTITFSLGSQPIPWTYVAEVFPMEVKEMAICVCSLVNNISCFIVLFSFNFTRKSIGMGPTFWLFASFNLIASVFVKFYVIETKGKSLMEIQKRLNA